MSAKSISIVTVSIFGSVFFGIFLSTLVFTENVSSNSEGTFETDSSKTPIEPSNESTIIEPSSSTSKELEKTVTPSSLTEVG